MFLGDKKGDIDATDDQHEAKDTLEQVFELADMVIKYDVHKLYHVVIFTVQTYRSVYYEFISLPLQVCTAGLYLVIKM